MTAPDRDAIRAWIAMLYPDLPGYLSAVTLPGGSASFYATNDLDRAADHLARLAATTNVYASCCTLREPPATGRGRAADVAAMPGLWCDLDLAGPGHKWTADSALRLPASDAEALAVVDDLELAPSAVIASGHGLYAWWLFTTPLVFNTGTDHAAGAALSAAFGATLAERGRRRGLHIDNVADLARILRVPGTVNRKTAPVAVRLIEAHPERRYTPDEVRAVCVAPEPAPAAPVRPPARPRLDGRESPAEAFARVVTWTEILEPAGFTLMRERGEVGYWRHHAATSPAGTPSATTDAHGAPVCVVHSESAAAKTGLPVGAGHRLTKFRTWAALNFHGDESAAATALRAIARGAA